MGKSPSLIAYPIFRLTVSAATGIFLFDKFFVGWTSLCWLGVFMAAFLLLLGLHYTQTYGRRCWFGVGVSLAFLLFGGVRVLQEKERIRFDWSGEAEVYVGRVLTASVVKGKTWQSEVYVEREYPVPDSAGRRNLSRGIEKGRLVNRKILWYYLTDSLQHPVKCGSRVIFEAKVSRPLSEADFTGFDYADYLQKRGFSGTALSYKGHWKILETEGGLSVKQRALLCRDWVVDQYRAWNLGKDELAVVAALTIGDKSVLSSELKEIYSAAGVSHVLALSGLHIGILSALLYGLLSPLLRFRGGKKLRSLLVVGALWLFAFISGLSASVVRAVTMCTLYLGASCVSEERFSGTYSLTLTAFLMLVYQPLYLFDLSFQLSFLAVFSILYFYPVMVGWLSFKSRILRYVWTGMAVSMAAQLGTLPLILYYFGTFPTYFLLSNFLVGVLAVCVLVCALLALGTSFIPVVGGTCVSLLDFSTWSLNASMRWVQHLAGSQLTSVSISASQALFGLIFLGAFYGFCTSRRPRCLVVLLLALNLSFLEWNCRMFTPRPPAVYFARGELYLKNQGEIEQLYSPNGLFRVDKLRMGVVRSAVWKNKQAAKKIELDYLYLCKGCRGSIQSLSRVFKVHCILLDASLSEEYRKYLIQGCLEMKVPYQEISEQGSFRIFL